MSEIQKDLARETIKASKFRFFSVGVVAANKELNSTIIEASPIEDFSMIDGEITDNVENIEVDGKDNMGGSYSSKVSATNTVQATWLPIGESNRITPPDVRRGAMIMLYKMGDEDKYYWTTLKQDNDLRRLETVVWAFSANPKENTASSSDSTYFLEISTHLKRITLHTSKANGEPFGYDVQINTGDGKIVITDDVSNYVVLDSKERIIEMKNADNSFVSINKMDVIINATENIIMKAGKSISQEAGTTIESSASNSISSKSPTINNDAASINMGGNLATSGGSFGGSGNASVAGNMDMQGRLDVSQGVGVGGTLVADKVVSTQPISAPNV